MGSPDVSQPAVKTPAVKKETKRPTAVVQPQTRDSREPSKSPESSISENVVKPGDQIDSPISKLKEDVVHAAAVSSTDKTIIALNAPSAELSDAVLEMNSDFNQNPQPSPDRQSVHSERKKSSDSSITERDYNLSAAQIEKDQQLVETRFDEPIKSIPPIHEEKVVHVPEVKKSINFPVEQKEIVAPIKESVPEPVSKYTPLESIPSRKLSAEHPPPTPPVTVQNPRSNERKISQEFSRKISQEMEPKVAPIPKPMAPVQMPPVAIAAPAPIPPVIPPPVAKVPSEPQKKVTGLETPTSVPKTSTGYGQYKMGSIPSNKNYPVVSIPTTSISHSNPPSYRAATAISTMASIKVPPVQPPVQPAVQSVPRMSNPTVPPLDPSRRYDRPNPPPYEPPKTFRPPQLNHRSAAPIQNQDPKSLVLPHPSSHGHNPFDQFSKTPLLHNVNPTGYPTSAGIPKNAPPALDAMSTQHHFPIGNIRPPAQTHPPQTPKVCVFYRVRKGS
mgnify:CR=1 FL=1